MTLQGNTICNVHVRIANTSTRKITFIVVDMQLPFVLGMLFLSAVGATVDFRARTMQIGQATLCGTPQEPQCKLHAMTMENAKAYE